GEVGGGERVGDGDRILTEIRPLVGGGIVDGVVVGAVDARGEPAAEVPELAVHVDGGGFPAGARVVRAEGKTRGPGAVAGDGDGGDVEEAELVVAGAGGVGDGQPAGGDGDGFRAVDPRRRA